MSPPFIRTQASNGQSPRPAESSNVPPRYADVCIHGIDVCRDPVNAGISHVRACVQLGDLLPLDVVVELECENADHRRMSEASPSRRMWSECSLHNGSFLFEAPVPRRELRGATFVCVTVKGADPSVDVRDLPVLTRRELPVP